MKNRKITKPRKQLTPEKNNKRRLVKINLPIIDKMIPLGPAFATSKFALSVFTESESDEISPAPVVSSALRTFSAAVETGIVGRAAVVLRVVVLVVVVVVCLLRTEIMSKLLSTR